MSNSIKIQGQLNQLRQDYLQRLTDKLHTIEACWSDLSIQWNYESLGTFHRLVHTLVGSSATFGLQLLSETARALEQLLQTQIEVEQPFATEQRSQINALLLKLRQQVETSSQPPEVASVDRFIAPLLLKAANISPSIKRLVFLVEDDPNVAAELSLQISYFGYQVQAFEQLEQLKNAMTRVSPAVIIMDIVFPEGNLAGTHAIVELNEWRTANQGDSYLQVPPVIFMSTRDDLRARLQAVRAGGDAYFTKPVKVNELIDKLDRLIEHTQPDPYRILIIEDDQALAEFHALTLQHAGMTTHIVTNPMQVMQPLSEFKPDLILMDIYMPSCSGLELAAVIRQQSTYVSIPIVFLSTETDLNKQLAAMSLGGDDFLTKPIQPNHLISSVASRAQRSATLRSLMVRDSLTGLFNHTRLKEQLSIEVKRAIRHKQPLAFAMIDIDHFKQVNDTYGHAAGDRVIKSLSRLLQQRLRQTDVVGRYGGEEFAVILVNTDATNAAHVMNEIRQSFAQVQQWADGVEFNVTFSCGIAPYTTEDAASLSKSADKALYRAKVAGRNQVVLADAISSTS